MTKLASVIAAVGLMAFAASGSAQAQSQTFGRIVSGQPAPLQKAMTQAQARKLCAQEMAGTRESKSALRQKMSICVRKKMEGL